jgi:uncharacterized protein (DUF58 family)
MNSQLCHDADVSTRSRWRAVADFLRPRVRRQVTPGGFLFAFVALVVALTAVVSANNLLFLILAALLATMMISSFISRLSLAGLELDFQLPEHVSSRRTFAGRIFVRNSKGWMPSFSVRVAGTGDSVFSSTVYFPVLPGGGILEEMVDVRFARRGVHREDGFQFATSFPFGFLERRAHVRLRREVLVYPCLDPQPGFEELLGAVTGEIAAHYRGAGHDFYRIRPYEAYESSRHVDWKATAHTGALQVREFAREQEPLIEILLDLDTPEPQAGWFEHAVDCCAFIAWRLTQKSARLRFWARDFQVSVPESGDIYTILKFLALVSPATGKPPSGPDDEYSFQLVFTAAPERYARTGWSNAHFVGPGVLAGLSGRPAQVS